MAEEKLTIPRDVAKLYEEAGLRTLLYSVLQEVEARHPGFKQDVAERFERMIVAQTGMDALGESALDIMREVGQVIINSPNTGEAPDNT